MNASDIRKKTDTEIQENLRSVRSELEKTVRDVLQNKEKNVKKPGAMRKDIARIKTIIAERNSKIESNLEEK